MKRIATPDRLAYCGWLKVESQPWQLAVSATTGAECERLLLDAEVPDGCRTVRRVVLPAGQLPVRRPTHGQR
jgi:hypothetical protein